MGLGKKISTRTRRIIAATSVTIFSLLTAVSGTFAWFAATMQSSITAQEFKVVRISDGAGLESVNLIKFEYPINAHTHKPDYSNGQDGEVRRYTLENNEFVDGEGNTTSVLNAYDPAEAIIYGESYSLFNSNCQAFYEITIKSDNVGSFLLDVEGIWDSDTEKRTIKDLFLSDCVDFCWFSTSDINNSIGINPETNKPYYYPTYIEYHSANPQNDMNELENLYYRLSYQASVKEDEDLKHFYPSEEDDEKAGVINIATGIPVTFTAQQMTYTIYIGINYAPSELSDYYRDVYSGTIITAVFDYSISFNLREAQS